MTIDLESVVGIEMLSHRTDVIVIMFQVQEHRAT